LKNWRMVSLIECTLEVKWLIRINLANALANEVPISECKGQVGRWGKLAFC
jgi:hypothetical protein